MQMAAGALESFEVGGRPLWCSGATSRGPTTDSAAHLLPYFDEYTVAYRDRSDVLDAKHARKVASGGMLKPTLVIDGRVVGTWRRELRGNRVRVTSEPFARLTRAQRDAAREAASRYAGFLGRVLELG
jgi:hypothetical protein